MERIGVKRRKKGGRKRKTEGVFFRLILAVCMTAFLSCFAANAQEWSRRRAEREQEAYYLEKEEALKQTVREYLDGQGFTGSGIMLTRIVSTDGEREYTLTVHHGRLDSMDEVKREESSKELIGLCFADEQCSFHSEFLLSQICRN